MCNLMLSTVCASERDTSLYAEKVRDYLVLENMAYTKVPGQNPAGISAHPIRLTIAGRDLPTLTIVDLPGIS